MSRDSGVAIGAGAILNLDRVALGNIDPAVKRIFPLRRQAVIVSELETAPAFNEASGNPIKSTIKR